MGKSCEVLEEGKRQKMSRLSEAGPENSIWLILSLIQSMQ